MKEREEQSDITSYDELKINHLLNDEDISHSVEASNSSLTDVALDPESSSCKFNSFDFADLSDVASRSQAIEQSISPFECDQCYLKYKRSSDLKRHIQTLHTDMSYPCSNCEKTFKRKDVLTRHFRSTHVERTLACS
eukprot:TRINITY_DN13468_c0_g1_i1.p1 TRINITY_DN13468_c0_g1~~TRINITY_DN13468_c0_g1_i1.p1  ORF type:complete len:155 (-),score=19.31 TRINITY_DN13468_c0_g1_i1:30-440(-)